MQQSFLTVKLYELEQQQGKLQARIRISQNEDPEEIKKEIDKIKSECEEEDILLKQSVRASHSKAVAALAEAQLCYERRVDEIVKDIFPETIHRKASFEEDRAETAMLYAEFSIDFALRAAKNAQCAALTAVAMELENRMEERE